ncbi:LacI family transcriptional regulator, xylobiose transport system transcriptional regulator [Nonomuraea solani]|uniref:LacI family transcriptional regulator, xylobiose transport system transcriptional regulator n=1 Tax=Nonomuraea solani TaxID=1144553 RepID=A0A1H6EZ92_9ACTN|nr:substrate-binding domain-containing protein [Nonomuraea solani]SEH02004.1 LacI family transcriptional regulator, xylobiose transport system transcriptional regulator [Nonomuraea solani]
MARATLADVAAAAGVSVPTVSKVLSGKKHVAAATRDKVLQAVRSSGYEAPRPPSTPRVGLVDLLIDGLGSPWAQVLVGGAEKAAARWGFSLVVTSSARPDFDLRRWIGMIRKRQTDGIVLVLSRADQREITAIEELLHVPLVLLDPVGQRDPRLSTVGATNWLGGVMATTHLLELGHTRIGFIGGPLDTQCTLDRYEGYLAAHRTFGIASDPSLTRYGDFLVEGGRKLALELLDRDDPPTAIFAGNDLEAAGVYQAATEQGIRVPDDLSVVGFDDSPLCEMLSPPLTTVRQPLDDMANEAVRLVSEELTHPRGPAGTRIELATTLIVRNSTARLD